MEGKMVLIPHKSDRKDKIFEHNLKKYIDYHCATLNNILHLKQTELEYIRLVKITTSRTIN